MLHFGKRQEQPHVGARLGLVIAKKLVKQAMRRNMLKRIIREQFRLLRDNLPARDVVMRLTQRPAKASRQTIATDVLNLLQQSVSRAVFPDGRECR